MVDFKKHGLPLWNLLTLVPLFHLHLHMNVPYSGTSLGTPLDQRDSWREGSKPKKHDRECPLMEVPPYTVWLYIVEFIPMSRRVMPAPSPLPPSPSPLPPFMLSQQWLYSTITDDSYEFARVVTHISVHNIQWNVMSKCYCIVHNSFMFILK